MDYYRALQVTRDADSSVIERAYKALSLKHHPDRVSADRRADATVRMQALNEAYQVLKDPESRRRYDATLLPEEAPGWDQFWNKGLVGMFVEKFMSRV